MTITQLITELQKLQAEHGDLPVTVDHGRGPDIITSVEPSDHDGITVSEEFTHIHLS
jgi:hypothetical protein